MEDLAAPQPRLPYASVAQVCLRWVIQHGAIVATGTGADPAKASAYAREDLDSVYKFVLTPAEMALLDTYGA